MLRNISTVKYPKYPNKYKGSVRCNEKRYRTGNVITLGVISSISREREIRKFLAKRCFLVS